MGEAIALKFALYCVLEMSVWFCFKLMRVNSNLHMQAPTIALTFAISPTTTI